MVNVVVGSKPWSRQVYDQIISHYPGEWYFIGSKTELTEQKLAELKPTYVFFLHWSWKVADSIVQQYECVCFHMTDLPYGRGGSPLQNLLVRGHQQTKLTALRMTATIDAGPIYLKEDLYLGGTAEEIYIRATYLSARMIDRIITDHPQPVPQTGPVVTFQRRQKQESQIPDLPSLSGLYDFVRMLDAEGYPKAFIQHQGFRYEFSRAALYDGRIVADVTITPVEEPLR